MSKDMQLEDCSFSQDVNPGSLNLLRLVVKTGTVSDELIFPGSLRSQVPPGQGE